MMANLPIDEVIPSLLDALRVSPSVVLHAPTGAGKTTRVPPALLDSALTPGQVIVLEPRRIAARAAARRIAAERGQEVGQEVGFQVRFERKGGPQTRLWVVTEGVLVRMLQADPFLEQVGALVFDEFHERSLDTDLSLAMALRVQQEARPDLKLVVMSATLDAHRVSAALGGCPVVTSQGRSFPVEVVHRPAPDPWRMHEGVAAAVRAACAEQGGHVLAFLPGTGEIRRTQEALAAWALEQGVRVVPLHGQLSPEEQDEALSLGGPRRVILATNVAETSLTLPGVRAVVDAGYARVLRHDPSCGLDRLELSKISQASADQRAGRAGREAPGLCVRLWSEHDHRARPAFEEPEVRRVDLAGPALQLMAWGESDLDAFPWVERPSSASLERARALLRALGALGPSGVTPLGQAMAAWPLHPRLARLMISAHELGVVRRAALAAALLAERDPWARQERGGGPKRRADSDVVERVEALEAFERGGRSSDLHTGAARNLLRARDQLARIAGQVLGREQASAAHPDEALGRALLAAFPDRLARRRQPGGARAVMVGGRGVSLDERSVVWDAELFLCVEMDGGDKADALVRVAAGVERAWLDPREVVRERGAIFDAEKGRVVAVERERWRELVLSERIAGAPDPLDAARILAQVVASDPARYLPLAEGELAQVLARVRFLARWMPELGLPSFEGEGLREVIEAGCAGLRALDELRRVDWAEQVSRALTWPQREALAREAPDKLEVPSGSFIRLDYQAEGPPILAARIQELFGLADTPKLAGGRVGVVMHLLAPNYRPQQVTQDLRSFWDKTYQEVRRELRQRYPKHSWPDDPWTAPPQRRPGRPRG